MHGKPGSGVDGPKGTGECEDASIDIELNSNSQRRAMACLQKGTDEKGNYVAYTRIAHTLELDEVWGKYCKPKLEACSCTSLLSRVLHENKDVDKITGYFDAHPMIAGCKCYLGSAAEAGFKYSQLKSIGRY